MLKNVFEKGHNISKKLHYQIQFLKYEKDFKGTWNLIKEFLAKGKSVLLFIIK